MRKWKQGVVGLGLVGLIVGCGAQTPGIERYQAALSSTDIPMRVFSTSPTLGAKADSVTDPTSPKYGALKVFMDNVAAYTGGAVTFSLTQWNADSGKTVVQQVGIGGDARDAAYDNGSALNAVWGFIYNSVPFGLSFDRMVEFLYERGGLVLAQSLLDGKGLNVKVLPVVGSEPQGSGFFKHPIGKVYCNGEADCHQETAIGLEGLCQSGWTWRYLPPAQYIVDRACDQLVAEGAIPSKRIRFVASIPGMSVLGAVQQGAVTAFEYATALDDYDPTSGFFPVLPTSGPILAASQNPGHKGLRFYHTPSWHQPFYVGWVMVNKSAVWNTLDAATQAAIERAAKDALVDSYTRSGAVQCDALTKMLEHNNGQTQLDQDGNSIMVDGNPVSADMKWSEWPKDALDRLQAATDAYLESLKGGAAPTPDQVDYATVIGALRSYMDDIHYRWKPNKFEYPQKACPQPMPL